MTCMSGLAIPGISINANSGSEIAWMDPIRFGHTPPPQNDAETRLIALLEKHSAYHPTLGRAWLDNVEADIRNLLHANKFAKALAKAQTERINTLIQEKINLQSQLDELQRQAKEVRQIGIRCCKDKT